MQAAVVATKEKGANGSQTYADDHDDAKGAEPARGTCSLPQRRKWLATRALSARVRARNEAVPLVTQVAFATTLMAAAALCKANDRPFAHEAHLQGAMQALFCLVGGAFYIVFMVVSRVVALVLTFTDDGRPPTRRYVSAPGDEEDARETEEEENEGEDEEAVPREVLISSMYLGGAGVFMAIPALCMWDTAATLAFALSLVLLSVGGDRLTARQCLAYAGVIMAFSAAVGTEVSERMVTTASQPPLSWPLMLLSGASPVLLRAGGGAVYVGGLYHGMPPTQTLETALPVCSLLAGLVLSWYSPLDALMEQVRAQTPHVGVLVAMVVLVPAFLAAALSILLRTLRARATLASAALLLTIVVARQQCATRGTPRTSMDALAALLAVCACVGVFWSRTPSS